MNAPGAARLFTARRWVALVLLAIGLIGYPVAWELDPFIFGVLLLGLGPLQIGTGLFGVLARIAWRDRHNATVAWTVDVLLIAMATAGYAFARTISWT